MKSNILLRSSLAVSFGAMIGFSSGCGQPGNISVQPSVAPTAGPVAQSPRINRNATLSAPGFKAMTKVVNVQSGSKVDILVIIDNSKSMAYKQKNMSERFGSFIDELQGLDWQLAITTTDVSEDAELKDGRLIPFDGNNSVLSSAMNLDEVKKQFAQTIQRSEVGSPDEQGVKATYRALERSQTPGAVNDGNRKLIRDGAALAVIVVSDSDETAPAGKDGKRVLSAQNMPQNLLDFVSSTWKGQKSFSVHSIVVPDGDKDCLSKYGSELYGLVYISLSKKTNGLVGSVCAADYGIQLAHMGQKVQDLVKSVRLECAPQDVNADSLVDISIANSNSAPIPGYRIEGLDLVFDSSLPLGTTAIQYSCLAE